MQMSNTQKFLSAIKTDPSQALFLFTPHFHEPQSLPQPERVTASIQSLKFLTFFCSYTGWSEIECLLGMWLGMCLSVTVNQDNDAVLH